MVAAMLKGKVILESIHPPIHKCVCVMGGGNISVGRIRKLRKNAVYIFRGDLFKIEDPIYLLSIYVANSTHVWFFTHVCGKIHILHRVQLCGFHHTGVFYCTYVWK